MPEFHNISGCGKPKAKMREMPGTGSTQRGVVIKPQFNHLIILLVFVFGIQAAHAQPKSEQITLITSDGLKISAQRIANGNEAALIYCHRLLSSGSSLDLDSLGSIFLHEFDVITFDFRGHGRSEGFSTCGGDEVLDLSAVIKYARQNEYRRIVVLGMGMGGTVAIRQAALFGNVDAVIAISPLGNPKRFVPWSWRMSTKLSAKVDYIRIPIRIIDGTRIGGFYLTGSPVNLVDRVSPIPLLIIHGGDDYFLNFRQTHQLYERAKEPKKILLLPKSENRDNLLDGKSSETIISWIKAELPDEYQQENAISRMPIPIKDLELRGDIVLPKQDIREAVEDADGESKGLDEQIGRIKEEALALHKGKGYSLSHVSDAQLSKDGLLSLEIEVDRIHHLVVEGNRQATSKQIWQELQTEEGDYYNSWEIEKSMKNLSRLSVIADFESRLDKKADQNTLRILIKEQRQWSVGPVIKIDSLDYFGGLSFALNKYRPGALRVSSTSLVGLEHRNLLYRLGLEKSWFSNRSLSTRFEFEQFINRRGILNYYFARQEARERGGGGGASYRVSDGFIIHTDFLRKKFAPAGGDEALPVGTGIINSASLRLENRWQPLKRDSFTLGLSSQSFLENATKNAYGDYDYTVIQLNLYPYLVLSSLHALRFGIHWGTSWGILPPQKMFSLGGIRTMPGYGFDAFVGEHIYLLTSRYELRFGKWMGKTSRWEPLAVSLLLDAGDSQIKAKPLKFDMPRLEAGVEFSYASVIKFAIFKSLGKGRVAPYIYFGWYPNIFLLRS